MISESDRCLQGSQPGGECEVIEARKAAFRAVLEADYRSNDGSRVAELIWQTRGRHSSSEVFDLQVALTKAGAIEDELLPLISEPKYASLELASALSLSRSAESDE